MIKCEGQKAECYQAGHCKLCQSNGGKKIDNGLLIEMFDEPIEWIHNIISAIFILGVMGLSMWLGWLCHQAFKG